MFDDFPTKEGCRTISHADSFGMGGIDYTDSVNYIKGTDKISEKTTWYIDGRARKTITIYHEDGTYDRTTMDGVEEKLNYATTEDGCDSDWFATRTVSSARSSFGE